MTKAGLLKIHDFFAGIFALSIWFGLGALMCSMAAYFHHGRSLEAIMEIGVVKLTGWMILATTILFIPFVIARIPVKKELKERSLVKHEDHLDKLVRLRNELEQQKTSEIE